MKTIVSLALAGLMSISALLPALAAQEAENVSIPESSGISESIAQDESSVSSSTSLTDENNSTGESDSVLLPPSSAASDGEEDSSTIVEVDSLPPREFEATSNTEGSLQKNENEFVVEGRSLVVPIEKNLPEAVISEEYALLLASNQADSMLGHVGLRRDSACAEVAAVFVLRDYASETEEKSYESLWEALNHAVEELAAEGRSTGYCSYENGVITLYK